MTLKIDVFTKDLDLTDKIHEYTIKKVSKCCGPLYRSDYNPGKRVYPALGRTRRWDICRY